MIHLGDVTKIDGSKVEPVDCITFGSPCQDLSVAGKRVGLDGERSGLFMEAVRIIREMIKNDRANGRADELCRPRFAVWENVPPFSSKKGEDFRVVLEELARLREPGIFIPRPQKHWTKAGNIEGRGWSIAWRQMDAQYWGVPQRRKRICLVVDLCGNEAARILFEYRGGADGTDGVETELGAGTKLPGAVSAERKGLPGNPKEGIPPWKGIARNPAESAGGYDSLVGMPPLTVNPIPNVVMHTMTIRSYSEYDESDISSTCTAHWKTGETDLVCVGNNAADARYTEIKDGNVPPCAERRARLLVRSLMPLEMERLQGFPDGWTDIGEWVDTKGKRHKPADSPRYKALGNSIACCCFHYAVQKMKPYLPARATLGSLFDGIGGFPLVWEECYGKGTARWASEIEEFPIAVTKIRFKEDEP